MEFCWIPSAEVQLGCSETEAKAITTLLDVHAEPKWLVLERARSSKKVKIPGFWLGKREVTQCEWTAILPDDDVRFDFHARGAHADDVKGLMTDYFPAEMVSYTDCVRLVEKMNRIKGVTTIGKAAIPTEDQWEYACRGADTVMTAFYFGEHLNGTQANCNGSLPFGTKQEGPYLAKSTAVGHYADKHTHPFGLCDMCGNIEEWCSTLYDGNKMKHVVKGGSWQSSALDCRSSARSQFPIELSRNTIGVRVAILPKQ